MNMYCRFMREYLELGHMELANDVPRYITPHYPVLKDIDHTIIRVVFDGSQKGSQVHSMTICCKIRNYS